jgi:hypothetical protein
MFTSFSNYNKIRILLFCNNLAWPFAKGAEVHDNRIAYEIIARKHHETYQNVKKLNNVYIK